MGKFGFFFSFVFVVVMFSQFLERIYLEEEEEEEEEEEKKQK